LTKLLIEIGGHILYGRESVYISLQLACRQVVTGSTATVLVSIGQCPVTASPAWIETRDWDCKS